MRLLSKGYCASTTENVEEPCAYTRGEIRIKSDGEPWRPLIHCRDIARAFVALAKAPRHRVHAKSINIGNNTENYQVKMISQKVQQFLPQAEVLFTGETGKDSRNYRVNFDRLGELLPNFRLEHNLDTGMRELLSQFDAHSLSQEDFDSDQFIRLKAWQQRVSGTPKEEFRVLV